MQPGADGVDEVAGGAEDDPSSGSDALGTGAGGTYPVGGFAIRGVVGVLRARGGDRVPLEIDQSGLSGGGDQLSLRTTSSINARASSSGAEMDILQVPDGTPRTS